MKYLCWPFFNLFQGGKYTNKCPVQLRLAGNDAFNRKYLKFLKLPFVKVSANKNRIDNKTLKNSFFKKALKFGFCRSILQQYVRK